MMSRLSKGRSLSFAEIDGVFLGKFRRVPEFVSVSSDLSTIGSIEIDLESLRIHGVIFAVPWILLFSHHAFGFDGVHLSCNRHASPSLCLRPGHVSVLCVLGLVRLLYLEGVLLF